MNVKKQTEKHNTILNNIMNNSLRSVWIIHPFLLKTPGTEFT